MSFLMKKRRETGNFCNSFKFQKSNVIKNWHNYLTFGCTLLSLLFRSNEKQTFEKNQW